MFQDLRIKLKDNFFCYIFRYKHPPIIFVYETYIPTISERDWFREKPLTFWDFRINFNDHLLIIYFDIITSLLFLFI